MTTGSGDCNHRHRGTATSSTKAPSSARRLAPSGRRQTGICHTFRTVQELAGHRRFSVSELRACGVDWIRCSEARASRVTKRGFGRISGQRPSPRSSGTDACVIERRHQLTHRINRTRRFPLVRRTAVGRWPCRPSRRFFGCVPWQPSGGEPTSYAEPIAAIQEARPSRDALLANVHAAAGSAEQGVGPNYKVSPTLAPTLRVLRGHRRMTMSL